jgi:molecular chaperone GrpE
MLKSFSNKLSLSLIFKKAFSVNSFSSQQFSRQTFKMTSIRKNFCEKKENEEKQEKAEETHEHKEHKEHKERKEHHNEDSHKYKELKQTHHELENKYELLKKKFEDVRKAYLENQQETKQIITRYDKQINDAKVYAISKFAKDILDVHDNFSRAMSSIDQGEFKNLSEEEKLTAFNQFLEGIEMTQDVLTRILKRHGVTEYIPLKEEFNPNHHEAVFDYADDDPEAIPGSVGQVMQSGFKIGDRILRPAKVGVIKKNK